jgi:hypothetical protein
LTYIELPLTPDTISESTPVIDDTLEVGIPDEDAHNNIEEADSGKTLHSPHEVVHTRVTLLENHHLDQSSPRHRHHPRLLVLFGVACTQEILMYKI